MAGRSPTTSSLGRPDPIWFDETTGDGREAGLGRGEEAEEAGYKIQRGSHCGQTSGTGKSLGAGIPQDSNGETSEEAEAGHFRLTDSYNCHRCFPGLLLINNRIVAIYATRVTREDCDRLGLEFGQASSQGALEAYAILQGVALWRSKLVGCCVTLTVESDSVVALALTQKLSGKSPALNYIGAELSILAEDAGIEEFRSRHIPGTANIFKQTTSVGLQSGRTL